MPEAHTVLLHGRQTSLMVVLYWPAGHLVAALPGVVSFVVVVVLVVPRVLPAMHLSPRQTVPWGHLALHGMPLHWKPLVVPLQDPVRCCPEPQLVLLQVLHAKPFVVPLQVPVRYCPLPQLALPHAVHVPGLAPTRY